MAVSSLDGDDGVGNARSIVSCAHVKIGNLIKKEERI